MKQRHRTMLLCVTATSLAAAGCKDAGTDTVVNDDAQAIHAMAMGKVAVQPIGSAASPVESNVPAPSATTSVTSPTASASPPSGPATHRIGKVANTGAPNGVDLSRVGTVATSPDPVK